MHRFDPCVLVGYESVPNFRDTGRRGSRSSYPVAQQGSTQYDPATMAPRYPISARLPVSTPYSYDPNAPSLAEVESLAASRFTGPLFSEPRSYQHSLTSHSTHSGEDGNDTEDSASRRGPEEDAPLEPGPSRRPRRKRRREPEPLEFTLPHGETPSIADDVSPDATPTKKGKKTEKACDFCRSECHFYS